MTIEGRAKDEYMRFHRGKNRVSRFRYSGKKPTNYDVHGRNFEVSNIDRKITIYSNLGHEGQVVTGDYEFTGFHVENGDIGTVVKIKEEGTVTISLRHEPIPSDRSEAFELEFKHTNQ